MTTKYTVKHLSPQEVDDLRRRISDRSPYREVLGFGEYAVLDEKGGVVRYCQVLSDTGIVIDQLQAEDEIANIAGRDMRVLYDELKTFGDAHNVPNDQVLVIMLKTLNTVAKQNATTKVK